jgi:cytochrome c-type biogenesis protein CcmH
MKRIILCLFLAAAVPAPALAVQPDEVLKDQGLEHRAREISSGLRCLVCQNQSIDESDAPLARDLRILVRDRLKEGDSDAQVRDYVVQRYGEFVLLKPVFALHTAILWLTPVLVLILGVVGLYGVLRRRRDRPATAALDPAEQDALAALLREDRPAS